MKSTQTQTIHVPKERLEQIEYILSQSTKGVHLLFDRDTLINTLQEPVASKDYFNCDNLNKVQNILIEIIKQPTIAEKRKYLATLEDDVYELFLRTYFNIVENTVLTSTPNHH